MNTDPANIIKTDPVGLSNQDIQKYAEMVGDHHKIYNAEGRADVDSLMSALGGRCDYARNNESLHIRQKGDFTIYLPLFTSERRDRFTKAHELGHYFLHYLYKRSEESDVHFGRGGRDRAETEANVFASALLMPSKLFEEAYRELNGDTVALASRFDVSPAAAEVRVRVLGLDA